MKIEVEIPEMAQSEVMKYQEIIVALISSGGMNLKNGKAVLHFDSQSVFQGVQLEYWAWKRKKA